MSVRLKISVFGLLLFLCNMPVTYAEIIVDGTPTPTEIDPTWVAASGSVVYVEADPSWVAASGSVVYVEADPSWVAASGSVIYVEADPSWVAASGSVVYTELDPSWIAASGGVRYTTGLISTNAMDATADAAYRAGGGDPAVWWYATMSADMLNIPNSVETPIAYNTIAQTNGCNYNTTTYTATNIPNGVYMFMLQVRLEDFDTQKWGRFTFNAIGGYKLTENFRYNEPENSTADLQSQAFESVYVVTNGNGACYPTWYSGDTQDDNDIGVAGAFFSGIKIHDYP